MEKKSLEDLYSPEMESTLPLRMCKLKAAKREDRLFVVVTHHVSLAIKCMDALFLPPEDNWRVLARQQARQQAQNFRLDETTKKVLDKPAETLSEKKNESAFLALIELEEYDWLKKALAGIGKPTLIHRQLIRRLMNKLTNMKSLLHFLSILFANHQASLNYRQYTPTMSSHILWLWALEDIPSEWGLDDYEAKVFQDFYQFFVQQPDYSETLNLLLEKFSPAEVKIFEQLLQTENNGIWLRRVYEEKIKRHPKDWQTHLAEMQENDVLLDEISYNTLINKCQTYEQGISLFFEMKQAGLTPNEISYSTLINKCQTYEQGISLFFEMKQAGLTPNEISYSTLINKCQTYEQGIKLFEEMKRNGLKPNVITFNTLLKKATQNKQALQVILDLLDEMINRQIKPQLGSVTKSGKRIKPHTIEAVQDKLRRSQKPYRAWVAQKYQQLENQPQWLQNEWEDFFRQTLKP